ncbi:23613_t:CDS:1, partial [Racocetra persica]
KSNSDDNFMIIISQSSESIFRDALVKWIATNNLLFTTVKSESFHKIIEIIKKLNGDVTVLSAKTVKHDLLNKYSAL